MQDKLDNYKQITLTLEQQLETEKQRWDHDINIVASQLKGDVKKLYEIDADVTSYRQILISETRKYSMIIHKENRTLKALVKSRFEWYSTKYQINIKSSGDKMKLIESDVADIQYKIDILDSHIDYLRNSSENLKQMGYVVKNRLELLNILGIS